MPANAHSTLPRREGGHPTATGELVIGQPVLGRMRRGRAALRAAMRLRPMPRFLACEATRAGLVGGYAIAGTGAGGRMKVHLRHGSRDIEIFNEIFPWRSSGCYEPPPAIDRSLAALGPLRIADLGANIGLFGAFALARWPVARLRSYEPDAANALLLRATIAANGARLLWEPVQQGVSNENATVRFEAGMLSECRLAIPGREGPGTREIEVLDLFAQPAADLLKIDIEGAEWAILGDARLAAYPARAIVLEWHSRMCPAPDPRVAARAALEAAGYAVIEPPLNSSRPGAENGLLWGLRR